MVIGFETPQLRALCEDEATAITLFGADTPHLLAALADLDSAPSLEDLPPGTAVATEGRNDRFVVEYGPICLLFMLNQKVISLDKYGLVDASKVTRVKVIEIKHHG